MCVLIATAEDGSLKREKKSRKMHDVSPEKTAVATGKGGQLKTLPLHRRESLEIGPRRSGKSASSK